jgi:peroxiredoxin
MLSAQQAVAAVDFALPDIYGVKHSLSDYRGKWVVVNYWATWCPPCLEEIPELDAFHLKHKHKDAVVLGVNREDIDPASLREFVDDHFISYPILTTDPEQSLPLGPNLGLPTTYLISPQGEIAASHLGAVSAAQIEKYIYSKTKSAKKETPWWMFWAEW